MSDTDEPASTVAPSENLEMEVPKECNPLLEEDITAPEISEVNEDSKKQEEPHFASMEGELLDFEDFNEKTADGENTKNPESEDVQPTTTEEKENSVEEGEDEGVCSEDEDLEEGEISSEKKDSKAVCRFYHRGLCFYGNVCRFLHPNDKKGNYSMFDQTPKIYADTFSRMGPIMNHRHPISFLPVPPPQPGYEVESAWERGLKEAKVLLKQASKRKDEPGFEEKQAGKKAVSKKYAPDFNKENDSSPKRERNKERGDRRDNFRYSNPPPRQHWHSPSAEEGRMRRSDNAHNYFDPWQRSRSPPRNRSSKSVSCSPVSSYSRSSRSSRSYSRSSSRSSCCSSRKSSSSRSRSVSRSISMDSVSSASSRNSSASHSSRSEPLRHRNAQISHRKAKPVANRSDAGLHPPVVQVKVEERDFLEERFHKNSVAPFPSLQHLIPDFSERQREPVKGLHKQNIRLTLLNKNHQPKLPKKDLEMIKKPEELQRGVKRPLSPPTVALAKKSASSRRDELLKQLRAVEDAIARKRAK